MSLPSRESIDITDVPAFADDLMEHITNQDERWIERIDAAGWRECRIKGAIAQELYDLHPMGPTPLSDVQDAWLSLAMAMYAAGIRHGAMIESLRHQLVSDLQT